MSLKSRILRILLVVTVVLLFAGYFAFSTFLFSPTEGDLDADVSALVPRDVDFFVAKSRLRDDFARFPELKLQAQLEETRAWRTWKRSPEYAELDAQYGIAEALRQLEELPEQLGVDPLKVFGGRDVSIAGYFKGPMLEQADWAAYGRVNWMGKLAQSLLSYPGLLGLEARGIQAASGDGYVELSGGQLARPLFVSRVRDVVVAGTSLELVTQAAELERREGQDSFGQGATYYDHIERAARSVRRNEAELYVDLRAYLENMQQSGRWPDTTSQDYLPRLLGRLFQLGSLKALAGVVRFDTGFEARLHGDLSSELMTSPQKAIYRTRGVERAWFKENVARMVRDDTALLLYAQIGLGDLLRQVWDAADRDTQQLIEDQLRSSGEYTGAEALISEIAATFRGRLAIIARENDFQYNPDKDPPNDGQEVPAVAVVFWTGGDAGAAKKINEWHDLIVRHQSRFGLEGLNPGDRGVFHHTVDGGFEVWEFWHRMIAGTGHISTVQAGDLYVLSNSFRMVEDVLLVLRRGDERHPRILDRPDFAKLVEEGLPQSNVVLWANPRSLANMVEKGAQDWARNQVLGEIDWKIERDREERRVLREQFPNERPGRVSEDVQAKLDRIVDPLMVERERKLIEEQVPVLRAEFDRRVLYLRTCSGILATLALDPKTIDLVLAVLMPLEADEG